MTMPDFDRRTLMAGALAGAALSSAPAMAQSFPLPKGFTRFPIWPGKAPGGEKVTVQEVETLRRPDSGPDDGVFAHIVTPTLTMLRPEAVGAARAATLASAPGPTKGRALLALRGMMAVSSRDSKRISYMACLYGNAVGVGNRPD